MQGRKPTREQRKFIETFRLNSDNWLVQKDTAEFMQLVHRHSSKVRRLPKGGGTK